jgi:hypothetical protein
MLTLRDLFSGNFTLWQLIRDACVVVLPSVCCFFAGYERGWNKGFKLAQDAIGEAMEKHDSPDNQPK